MSSPKAKKRKIGSRSCDACKIRKVRCTEGLPCERCTAIGIECTFNKTQSTRGPRSLRAKTIQQIREAQQQTPSSGPRPSLPPLPTPAPQLPLPDPQTSATADRHDDIPSLRQDITVEALVLRLCIYRLRLFPVWPIIAVEEVIAALQRDAHDVETQALAVAVGAATMAQLKLDRATDAGINDNITAEGLETECQRLRGSLDKGAANLNSLRTAFFLHIYHENQQPGGTRSLLYLREAITLAQLMGLHRRSSYLTLDYAQDRLRRRVLWLLFVTERGVAMLHKLPLVLQSTQKLPPLDATSSDEDANILPAFKKLVNLFWTFDQSGAFDILQDAADNFGHLPASASGLNHEMLNALQHRLQDARIEMGGSGNDVQKADIVVTLQWMKVLLWRATLTSWGGRIDSSLASVAGPIQIAQEFLDFISQLPSAALEAHGPTIEFKVFEIASAVADCLASHLNFPIASPADSRPGLILERLRNILETSRGGNGGLLSLLSARIAQAELSALDLSLAPRPASARYIEDITEQEPQGLSDSLSYQPPSPWMSLVAAAEWEQQSMSYGGLEQGTSPNASEGMRTSMDWLAGPMGLVSHVSNGDGGPSSTTDESSPSVDFSSVDPLSEMLHHQSWLMDSENPRIG
ncbi:hypothetical protein B0T18DRAFT_326731 [Schizothecium vesticola]|uniref:Zn(2)-C6 fungal-type domain-containing protein n=1 Tax=Schizothecium vesticola TaxID=314040 RepID=A0AA40EUC4_9PEZI|nr:hypothetical protein B0T18DRAFT_326731 [Schizothecium vesticola]